MAISEDVECGGEEWVGQIHQHADYYNLLYRDEEQEMTLYCKDAGVGLRPWSPLGRGILSRSLNDRSSKRDQTN